MRRVLLAVDSSTPDLSADDRVLAAALRARGVDPVPRRWGLPVERGDVVIVRSTWDYVERTGEFLRWLAHLDEQGAFVVNPTTTLRWNVHKAYLLELERRGVDIVPTVLVGRGRGRHLDDVRSERGWDHVVVKPAIGGTARRTVHSGLIGLDAAADHLARLSEREDVLVQPVIASVASRGEVSVLAVAGEPTAAVVKVPAAGEWRVQSDFGGTARPLPLSPDLVAAARDAIAAAPERPVYARVDLVRHDDRWLLMELELVEPELFFGLHPRLADELADRIVELAAGAATTVPD